MFDRSQQQVHDRGGDRGQITNARQAAEALFAPKRQSFKQIDQEAAPPAGGVRRPRVLTISPTLPSHPQDLKVPISREEAGDKPEIPKSQFARIRAWQRYGMTAEQVAEVYGVRVGEIEHILRIAR